MEEKLRKVALPQKHKKPQLKTLITDIKDKWASVPIFSMKKFSSDKDIQKFVAMLIRSGWVYMRGSKHGKLRSPEGKKITVPGSPSDKRAYKNFVTDIRRIARST